MKNMHQKRVIGDKWFLQSRERKIICKEKYSKKNNLEPKDKLNLKERNLKVVLVIEKKKVEDIYSI